MTDLHTDVERYLRYLSVERQLSPITLLNYQRQLEAIINFASENGLQSWQQCDVTMVRNFAVRSRRKGLGAASLALRLSALRSFFDWLVSQNELKANPAKGVSAPKAPRHLPKNIDVDDMNRLLDIDINDPLAVRDRAMLEVMYATGIRVSECVGLDLNDINFEVGGIKIRRKGGYEAVIYFGDEVETALLDYLEERERIIPADGHENALFLSLQNRRIAVRSVENLVKKYASRVTTLKKITPHKLRSTYGTNLYKESGDIYLVADVLGHKDVNTTRKHYAALEDERRRRAASMVRLRKDN